MTHSIEHQIDAIIQLDAEPIPAGFPFRELVSSEFVIHPTLARYPKGLCADTEDASGRHSGDGVVVRGVTGCFSFLTHSADPMNRRHFAGLEIKLDCGVTGVCRQFHRSAIEASRPVLIPDVQLVNLRPRNAGTGSIHPFEVMELTLTDISHRKMRH